ncbi:hypothetical protein ACFOKI_14595 [Sphingomonas qilianensis]|uniref:hypothetical protein n=1 Tax=Sphingomonas qilianensis TaxID=1736690 RepID=UPI003607D5AF
MEGMEGKASIKLFDKVDPSRVTKGAPAVVFYPVPDSHIEFTSPEEIKAWEHEVRERLGVKFSGNLGIGSESCSAGCSDDCD